jgi:hypothetical protein
MARMKDEEMLEKSEAQRFRALLKVIICPFEAKKTITSSLIRRFKLMPSSAALRARSR